jgi:membrane-associated phospholipid phosphatase
LIENQLVDQLDLDLERASEMYAMVGVALADSFISCWSLKYQVLLLRPVSYIQQHIRRSWNTYIASPGFPSYPSGHSVVSAAAAEVLTDLFGTVAFTDASATSRGYAPRYFTSFRAAASEAAISRLYGGIHYRVDIENGMIQGACVGLRVANTLELNPIRQGE